MLLDSGLKGIFINALHENCVGFCGITTGRTTGTSCSNAHGTPPPSSQPSLASRARALVRFVKERKHWIRRSKSKGRNSSPIGWCIPFEGGPAKVCLGYVDKCADRECEHHLLLVANGFQSIGTG